MRKERLAAIDSTMAALERLVSASANERALQAVLHQDPGILALLVQCAIIWAEYVVFSEYPVGDGVCDFVVLSDRSRMAVTFVEVKGADFHFLNKNGTIAHRIGAASQQVRTRLGAVDRDYETFRIDVHRRRLAAERGEYGGRALVGPRGYMQVDPGKDVKTRGLVIGGRTREDLSESREKHKLERENPRIVFESWDSLLRKCRNNRIEIAEGQARREQFRREAAADRDAAGS